MDTRAQAACDWARSKLDSRPWSIETIGSDASQRRYFRLASAQRSVIVMDAPAKSPDIPPFIDIQQRLSDAELNVPDILASDPSRGLMLLTDLGRQTFLDALKDPDATLCLDDALNALCDMQTRVHTDGLDAYDAARLQQELDLFVDWFLAHHWQVTPTDVELKQWRVVCAELIALAQAQCQVFCHRDFMPRNLMVSEPNPGIIDFQDALLGPITYDLVSLYMDAFISWPRGDVDAAFETHRRHLLARGVAVPDSADQWRLWCDAMSIQRHLKVIGIFARIAYRDHKPHYLADTPRFFGYLDSTLPRLPNLSALQDLIDGWQQRATPKALA
ncbi:MAG: phosphotransferase [Wenzhouxiangella sp.]|nr:phosphotransferase [Wenzhouxiangella sp.]MDR9452628.1 phosphotransferase [Wenzhouxiangella sp.]